MIFSAQFFCCTLLGEYFPLYANTIYQAAIFIAFDLDEDQLANPDWYIGKCRPRIGVDFIKTARGMLTDEIRQELKNLDGFRFRPHSDIELPEERLNRLSEIVERQRRAILA